MCVEVLRKLREVTRPLPVKMTLLLERLLMIGEAEEEEEEVLVVVVVAEPEVAA